MPPSVHRPGVKLPTEIEQSSLPRPPEGPTRDSAVCTGPSKAKGRSPSVTPVINTILEELKGLHHQQCDCLWFADMAKKSHQHNIMPLSDVIVVQEKECLKIGYIGPWSKLHGDDLPAAVQRALDKDFIFLPGWNM